MKKKEQNAYMRCAFIYAGLSYCTRLKVGCLIVKEERVISIGYNGTPSGWENVCEDANNTTYPYVYHAEANAIAKMARSDVSGAGASLFVTTEPCFDCAKLIAQVKIKEVFWSRFYRDTKGIVFLKKCGIFIKQIKQEVLEKVEEGPVAAFKLDGCNEK